MTVTQAEQREIDNVIEELDCILAPDPDEILKSMFRISDDPSMYDDFGSGEDDMFEEYQEGEEEVYDNIPTKSTKQFMANKKATPQHKPVNNTIVNLRESNGRSPSPSKGVSPVPTPLPPTQPNLPIFTKQGSTVKLCPVPPLLTVNQLMGFKKSDLSALIRPITPDQSKVFNHPLMTHNTGRAIREVIDLEDEPLPSPVQTPATKPPVPVRLPAPQVIVAQQTPAAPSPLPQPQVSQVANSNNPSGLSNDKLKEISNRLDRFKFTKEPQITPQLQLPSPSPVSVPIQPTPEVRVNSIVIEPAKGLESPYSESDSTPPPLLGEDDDCEIIIYEEEENKQEEDVNKQEVVEQEEEEEIVIELDDIVSELDERVYRIESTIEQLPTEVDTNVTTEETNNNKGETEEEELIIEYTDDIMDDVTDQQEDIEIVIEEEDNDDSIEINIDGNENNEDEEIIIETESDITDEGADAETNNIEEGELQQPVLLPITESNGHTERTVQPKQKRALEESSATISKGDVNGTTTNKHNGKSSKLQKVDHSDQATTVPLPELPPVSTKKVVTSADVPKPQDHPKKLVPSSPAQPQQKKKTEPVAPTPVDMEAAYKRIDSIKSLFRSDKKPLKPLFSTFFRTCMFTFYDANYVKEAEMKVVDDNLPDSQRTLIANDIAMYSIIEDDIHVITTCVANLVRQKKSESDGDKWERFGRFLIYLSKVSGIKPKLITNASMECYINKTMEKPGQTMCIEVQDNENSITKRPDNLPNKGGNSKVYHVSLQWYKIVAAWITLVRLVDNIHALVLKNVGPRDVASRNTKMSDYATSEHGRKDVEDLRRKLKTSFMFFLKLMKDTGLDREMESKMTKEWFTQE
jgi:hypothetical protein